jgi:hypothetical protein
MPYLKTVSVVWGAWPRAFPKTWSGDTTDPDFKNVTVMPRWELESEEVSRVRMVYDINVARYLWDEGTRSRVLASGDHRVMSKRFLNLVPRPFGLKGLPGNLWDSNLERSPLEFFEMRVVWASEQGYRRR